MWFDAPLSNIQSCVWVAKAFLPESLSWLVFWVSSNDKRLWIWSAVKVAPESRLCFGVELINCGCETWAAVWPSGPLLDDCPRPPPLPEFFESPVWIQDANLDTRSTRSKWSHRDWFSDNGNKVAFQSGSSALPRMGLYLFHPLALQTPLVPTFLLDLEQPLYVAPPWWPWHTLCSWWATDPSQVFGIVWFRKPPQQGRLETRRPFVPLFFCRTLVRIQKCNSTLWNNSKVHPTCLWVWYSMPTPTYSIVLTTLCRSWVGRPSECFRCWNVPSICPRLPKLCPYRRC